MIPELELRTASIAKRKKWFVDQVQQMGEEKATQRVQQDEWSLSEVIEHLVIAERFFTAGFEANSTDRVSGALPLKLRRKMILFVLKNGIKVPTPSERVIPKGQEKLETLLPEWSSLDQRLNSCLANKSSDQLGCLAFKHPRAGDLDVVSALDFLDAHLLYHQKRAAKVFGLSA